jgi:predicted aldo/keto reductase-like oxidoreductase
MNRRNFLSKSSKQFALLNIFGFISAKNALGNDNRADILEDTKPENIIYRTLGRTNLKVPVVSMGVMNATIPGLVTRSYDKGVRLFDTAWFYQNGMNEKMLGESINKLGVRDEVVIMTKVYLKETERDLYNKEAKKLFIQRFEESLERMGTDYADVLFYHATKDIKEQNNPYIMEAFEELKAAGKYKFSGISFHGDNAALLDNVVEKKFYDVAMIMFNIALAEDTRLIKSMENAAKEGVGIVAMKTQCGGGGNMWWKKHEDSRATIGELNHKAMLKWVLQHEFIATAIPGYTTYDQLDENFSVASDISFSSEEKSFLDRAEVKLASSFCVQCNQCKKTCARNADIPTLMRTYMYAYQYQNMEHAIATERTIQKDRGLNSCFGCEKCTAKCPRSVNLAQRIGALKELNFLQA